MFAILYIHITNRNAKNTEAYQKSGEYSMINGEF